MKSTTIGIEKTADGGSLLQQAARTKWFWLSIFSLSLFSILTFLGARLLADADTLWHIATGNWILVNQAVPSTDPFSFSFRGEKWVPHEWLAEVVLAISYAWAGWAGPVLVTALATSAALTVLLRFLLRYIEPLHAFTGIILAFLTLAQHLLARPHTLAWPLMVVWVAYLVQARERGTRPSLWLLLVMVVWANLHASFLLGILLACALGCEAVLTDGNPRAAAKAWAPFVALSVLVGLITPNGVDGLLFPLHVSGMTYTLSIIDEWRPPEIGLRQPIVLWLALMLFGAFYFGIRMPATRIVMFLGLVYLSLTAVRYAELPGLLAPILLAPCVGPQLRAAIRPEQKARLSPRALQTVTFLSAVLLLSSAVFLARGISRSQDPVMPRDAVRAAVAAGASGPVFNSYGFGGYLIFSGIAPIIDGRADLYGDDFVRRYMQAYSGDAKVLDALIRDLKIRWAVLEPSSPAAQRLRDLTGWRVVHEDRVAVAYVREP